MTLQVLSEVLVFTFFIVSPDITKEILHVPYSPKEIVADGDLSEWKEYFEYSFADTLHSFLSINSANLDFAFPDNFNFDQLLLPKSKNKVVFRAFWNKTFFNCAFIVWDKHLFADKPGRIDKPMIHLNDGIELYIDTKNEHSDKMDINDYQFLTDIKNEKEVFKGDLKEILADTVAVPKDYAQNVLFFSGIKVYGTLNDNLEDSLYIIEISIPFAGIGVVPQSNMRMHLDICVNDIDYPSSEARYVEEVSTAMWPFNWSGYSDFGYPRYWKEIQLTGGPGWYEKITEKYKSKWFGLYVTTFFLSMLFITFLTYRVKKMHRMPPENKIDKKKIMVRQQTENLSYNEKVLQKAARHVIDHHADIIHTEDLANILGLSVRSFQRITREELNVTPTNYICIIKLNLAADFLKNREGNVTEAAYRFGFTDPSYFSRQFKKHFGVAPRVFVNRQSQ